jgi:molecular chaperone DnaK (HSP70)
MKKWADYLISEVSYDSEHLILVATRHKDTSQGITKGQPIDRLTIASDIKNGLLYITIYSGNDSWKKGHKINTFSISGTPYLRIDKNKANLDYLGDLPESSFVNSLSISELESKPEPVEPEPPSSPRGSLPKESAEELPQELDLAPEPVEPEEEEATPEQLTQVNDLQQQIDDLENILSHQNFPDSNPEEEEATPEQFSKVKELEKEIEKLEAVDIEHEIIQTLRKQNKKLDDIENKLHHKDSSETKTSKIISQEAYCVKCKTKRIIKNPEETIMKNGRSAIKGFCSVCECKVFRIGKMKK